MVVRRWRQSPHPQNKQIKQTKPQTNELKHTHTHTHTHTKNPKATPGREGILEILRVLP